MKKNIKIVSVAELFKTGIKELDESDAFKELIKASTSSMKSEELKSIIVIDLGDNLLKIAISINPSKAIHDAELKSGKKAIRTYITPKTPLSYKIKNIVTKKYISTKKIGDYIEANYEEIVKLVDEKLGEN